MDKKYIVTRYDNEDNNEVKSFEFLSYDEASKFIRTLFANYIKEAVLYEETEIDRDKTYEPCYEDNKINPYSVLTYSNGSKIEFFFSETFDSTKENI